MTFVDDLLIKMKLLNQILGPTYDGLLLTDRPNRLGDSIEGRHSHGSRVSPRFQIFIPSIIPCTSNT